MLSIRQKHIIKPASWFGNLEKLTSDDAFALLENIPWDAESVVDEGSDEEIENDLLNEAILTLNYP